MGKTDIHLHLGPETCVQNMGGGKMAYASGTVPHETVLKLSGVREMLPHLRELGIRRGILMSAGESGGVCNEAVRRAAAMEPDVYAWMCNVDETSPETLEERLARCKALGAVGVGEFAVNRWISDPLIQAVFAAAEKTGLPVLFHMSPEEGFNYGIADKPGLPLLEEALRKYPNLIFVGHSQPFWHEISADAASDNAARNSWGSGPVVPGGRLAHLFEIYGNLYGDLSANSGGMAVMRDEQYGLWFLEAYQDRLMFGTDMINTEMEFPLGRWLDQQLAQGRLPQKVYDKICFENARRVFGV